MIKNFKYYISEKKWYHGTPEANSFNYGGEKTSVEILKDVDGYYNHMDELSKSERLSDEYFKLLNDVSNFKTTYVYPKPLFLTDKYNVANTYADSNRAFDYQNSKEKVYDFDMNTNDVLIIYAKGKRFRFIDTSVVKKGFIEYGVDEDVFDMNLKKMNFYLSDKTKIKTDMIAALGNMFSVDIIDVVGVLDSYHGGSVESTVRMILNKEVL